MRTHIPVLFFYDKESQNWGFMVEQPSLVGGGDATLDEAKQHALKAISFALRNEKPSKGSISAKRTFVRRLSVEIGIPAYRPLKVSTAKVRYERRMSDEMAGDKAQQVSAETGVPATYAEAEDGFDIWKVMADRLMREEARLFLTGERNMSLYDDEEKPAPPRVAAWREKLTAKRAENAAKPLYVAVVTRGLSLSGSLIPSAGRPASSSGGDWASFVGYDKDDVIRKALEAADKYGKLSTYGAQYTVLVGTLNETAQSKQEFTLKAIVPDMNLSDASRRHVKALVNTGNRIEGIRYVRNITGCDLLTAKHYVDNLDLAPERVTRGGL